MARFTDQPETTSDQDILSNIVPKAPKEEAPLTVDDIFTYVPDDLTPSEKAVYGQMRNQNGALPNSTYFPAAHNNINKGSYSGSVVGNVPIFAPSSQIPFGLIDQREANMQAAANAKAREMSGFYKKYKPPVTKHTSVQGKIDDAYFDGLNQWVDNAEKKHGKNWASALDRDLGFQRWNQSMNTIKTMEDGVTEYLADLETKANGKDFVLSPETKKLMGDFKAGLTALSNPFDPNGHNLPNTLLKLRAEENLDKIVNDNVDKLILDVTETDPSITSQGIYDLITTEKTTNAGDDRLKELAKQTWEQHYGPESSYTVDTIYKRYRNAIGEKKEKGHMSTHANQFRPDKVQKGASKDDVETSIANNAKFNTVGPNGEEQQFTANGYLAFGNDYVAPVTIGGGMIDMSTNRVVTDKGVSPKATMSGITVVPILKKNKYTTDKNIVGSVATDTELKEIEAYGGNMSDFIEYVPAVTASYDEQEEYTENRVKKTRTVKRSGIIPLKNVENVIATEKVATDRYKKLAEEKNAELNAVQDTKIISGVRYVKRGGNWYKE